MCVRDILRPLIVSPSAPTMAEIEGNIMSYYAGLTGISNTGTGIASISNCGTSSVGIVCYVPNNFPLLFLSHMSHYDSSFTFSHKSL